MTEAATNVLAQSEGKNFIAYHADAVEVVKALPSDSVHYTIFSPPFASIYTYSDSDRDMGNVKDAHEFAEHFAFLVPELLRATMPGRVLSMHCMNLPTSKARDGVIGLQDFRGELIRTFVRAGWIYHSEVCIWKDPVTAMQRTKALGLLHKQIKKDSCMSRQGIADYLVTFRRPGDNPERVEHTDESFPVAVWQRYASPVWMDIDPSRTLQYASARDDEDERHICPLQLDVIERAIELWTNPGDVVLSPFMGIGSEGWCALRKGRKFVGSELKRSYFEQASRNLANATPEVSLAYMLPAEPVNESPATAHDAADREVFRLTEQVASLEAQIVDLDLEVDAARKRRDEAEDNVERLDNENEELRSELRGYENSEAPIGRVCAAVHDLLRDERVLADAAHDVPFSVAPTLWRDRLITTVGGALT